MKYRSTSVDMPYSRNFEFIVGLLGRPCTLTSSLVFVDHLEQTENIEMLLCSPPKVSLYMHRASAISPSPLRW